MIKLNHLFYTTTDDKVFLDRIVPTQEQTDVLVAAKNAIRDHLRPRIQAATSRVLGMDKEVMPRFRTQGSWSYKTCVQPACHPPQEMDWDFGVYLPVTVWEESGPPHAMAKLYFELVERLLSDLCKEKAWTLYHGKDACIRVQINTWAHIDIPLYAAPKNEFTQILEKAALSRALSDGSRDLFVESYADVEFSQQQWEDMVDIVMATRTGEWKASDPEEITRWFLDRVLEYTDQLRRVCRYLKAWRDYQWKDGTGPTSVCLMVAVAQSFELHTGRDDLALEKAARKLATTLRGEVREAAIADGAEDFNKRLDTLAREDAARRAAALAEALRSARLQASHQSALAIILLQGQLGERVPNRVDLVQPDSGEEAIRLIAADHVSRPVVKPTSAG